MPKKITAIERLRAIFDAATNEVAAVYLDEVKRICAIRGIGKRNQGIIKPATPPILPVAEKHPGVPL